MPVLANLPSIEKRVPGMSKKTRILPRILYQQASQQAYQKRIKELACARN
jgi:hypothetical protein